MGWKAVKDAYNIEHIVEVDDGNILISSDYLHGIIKIDPKLKTIEWGTLGERQYGDLARYWCDLHADLDKLWQLADAKDEFSTSLPVYSYSDGKIIEDYCEEYGWPNVTHTGKLMYDNVFFSSRNDAIKRGIRNAEAGVEIAAEHVETCKQKLADAEKHLMQEQGELNSLRSLEGGE